MMAIRSIFIGAWASAAMFGQAPAARPEFEVASIKPSAQGPQSMLNIGLHIDGAQVRCSYFALRDYLGLAYRVKYFQVIGPEWLASTRFDISAKLPADAARDKVPEMFQTLIESRFQMKMHREKREFPVYALVVAKTGLKMKESPADGDAAPAGPGEAGGGGGGVNVTASGSRDGVSLKLGGGSSFSLGNNKFEARKLSMASLAEMLTRFEDRPVVDMTELKGIYDFTLECTPEDFRAMTIRSAIAAGVNLPPEAMRALESSGDSLFAAMQKLGLKLESRKAPIEVLVIDQMEKAPSEN